MEDDSGKYTFKESSRGVGLDLEYHRKEMIRNNKVTGEQEQLVYQLDERGNETYFRIANGKKTLEIKKTDRGITIDTFKDGQLYETYSYDENGRAIENMGMPGKETLESDFVQTFFDTQVPYFEIGDIEHLGTQADASAKSPILDSAVEATKAKTRTGTINQEVQKIKEAQKEKTEQSKEER